MDEPKTHYISRKLADYRESDRTCPMCCDGTRIKKQFKLRTDEVTGSMLFEGEWWECEKHIGNTDHYQLSPGGGEKGAKPRETVGAHVPKRFHADYVEPPRSAMSVHKRSRDGTITPLAKV